ncbi:UDP-4-amino-4,6-dideoxy-N-acetyl-beta-L-altrosamine transaminase [Lentilitoribacter sp. EG35]|uniref:UDP-4-amino-4, 6-dideoxy-N-acetyl-beta-L-altrosamine transaminase n=1 Tax=Lentilitoribacter sp. EG35 TaxID=3234192 RepID=UPI00345F1FE5
MIPYGRQDISQSDIDAVIEILKSDFLTQGPTVEKFENSVATYCGARHGIATNSATSALHIACLALGLGPKDILWTSPTTFVASANCALYCGASIDFVDIDLQSHNMCVKKLEHKLIEAEKTGNLPKIVMPVHLTGQPSDMAAIKVLADRYNFKIIEDASHAIGAKYCSDNTTVMQSNSDSASNENFLPIGNCQYSDICVFSFHPVKIITTGEGGLATTNDNTLAERMQRFRSHGVTSNPSDMFERPNDEIWNYQQTLLGYNYRMTDIQAALGISQLGRLSKFVQRRHLIADVYNEGLKDLPIALPWQSNQSYSSYHLYVIKINELDSPKTQREVYDILQSNNINVNLHYIPVYRQPYYEKLGFKQGYCSNAERYHKSALSIPMFPKLEKIQQTKVIEILHEIFS